MTFLAIGTLTGVFVGLWFHRRALKRRVNGRIRGL